jgi:hypothetical protein
MHDSNKNYVEAALSLQLHSFHLSYDSSEILPFFSEEYPSERECDRKERLDINIIKLFEMDEEWELCKKPK